ncbi:hypothetical protein Caci_2732 [Catenulispora acidiphila DSM 44928]|uniref:Uncharacterized protein n=1 Tax=Catenulispora acidiphila (strain DSM 44928 / JCM 14897 / NBRC 102108 / NRRL B-24433 / ID139908) TaxID=479433 RepID=C7PZI9_CATAD|nr:hypothetical protein [Catenulispora acidiphila]ACU71646.1 hypothetical protein Caci_2732 [Catenulispora acidiphila DSM 44928]
MTVPTRIAAVPELEERFVRRSLWVLGCWVMLLYVLWEAWELYAPWRTQAFLRAAGFRGVSFDAAQESTQRNASSAPLLVAVAVFAVCGAVTVATARNIRVTAARDVRRVTAAMIVVMTLAVAGPAVNQVRTAADMGHRLSTLPHVTQSSVDDVARHAGVSVTVLGNVDYNLAGQRVHLPGPVLVLGRAGSHTTGTVYGVDAVTGKAFTVSPDQKITYSDGPR